MDLGAGPDDLGAQHDGVDGCAALLLAVDQISGPVGDQIVGEQDLQIRHGTDFADGERAAQIRDC